MDSARPSLPPRREMSAATYAAPAAVASATAGRAARRARVGAKVGSPRRRSGASSRLLFNIGAAHFGGPADPWRRRGARRAAATRPRRAGARIPRRASLAQRATPERVPRRRLPRARRPARSAAGRRCPRRADEWTQRSPKPLPTPSLLPGVARHPQIRRPPPRSASLPSRLWCAPTPIPTPSPAPRRVPPPRRAVSRDRRLQTLRSAATKNIPNRPDADRTPGRDRDRDVESTPDPRFLVFPLSVWRGPFVFTETELTAAQMQELASQRPVVTFSRASATTNREKGRTSSSRLWSARASTACSPTPAARPWRSTSL